jgi:ADP-heptose:LPS heptosyltransferase
MLVAAPERWDEACFAVPAVRALIASGLDTGILCAEVQRKFWETIENLEVIDFPPKSKAKGIAAKISGKWQASLAWEAGMLADTFKIAAIPRRLGPSEKKVARQLSHPLAFAVSPLDHRVRFYLAAIKELGVSVESAEFFAPAAMGAELVAGAVLLCPDSDFGPSHEWRIECWLEIASRLPATHRHVTVAIGGGRGLGKMLADKLGVGAGIFDAISLAGALPGLAGYGLVIAADGSLPHLAAHAGATCITLFGPNDPAWKRPLGRRHAVARRHVECAPCLLSKCPLDRRCQNELEVDQVWKAVAELSHGIDPSSF